MGGTNFEAIAIAPAVGDAYQMAVEEAYWMSGHGGYTGTIAEKSGFVEFELPKGVSAQKALLALRGSFNDLKPLAEVVGESLAEQMRDVYENKWGPAVALNMEEGKWLFCGIASC